MSRGIGARQIAILKMLEDHGPMASVDLAVGMWESLHGPGGMVPVSFYESTRRAAATLAAKGLILAGVPESPPVGRLRAKAVYWLSRQAAPELRRRIPRSVFEHGILKALANGPLSYSSVVYQVGSHLTRDQHEYERLRGSISAAVKRLVTAGKVRRYVGSSDDLIGEREMLSVVL